MEIITNNSNVYDTEIKSYNDYIYKNSVSLNKFWDEEVVNEIIENLEDGTDIIDVGANIGLITLGIIKKAKNKNKTLNKIHCFECDPKIIPLLISNISKYDFVKIYPFAISNKQQISHITTLEQNMGCNYIYKSNDENQIKEYDYSELFYTPAHKRNNNVCLLAVPLDSIQYQFSNRIGIIKIDVEGHEINVLEGAVQLIQKHRPIIITEVFEKINFEKILEFFEKMKYVNYRKIPNSIYSSQDYIFYPT